MSWIFTLTGCTAGGWIGWWLGAHVGVMTGWFLSVLGSGAGLFAGRRFVRAYLE